MTWTSFQQTTGEILRQLRASRKAPGQERIYTAGEKEYLAWLDRKDRGVPVNATSANTDSLKCEMKYGLSSYKFNMFILFDIRRTLIRNYLHLFLAVGNHSRITWFQGHTGIELLQGVQLASLNIPCDLDYVFAWYAGMALP